MSGHLSPNAMCVTQVSKSSTRTHKETTSPVNTPIPVFQLVDRAEYIQTETPITIAQFKPKAVEKEHT